LPRTRDAEIAALPAEAELYVCSPIGMLEEAYHCQRGECGLCAVDVLQAEARGQAHVRLCLTSRRWPGHH
jgi:ferredoxin